MNQAIKVFTLLVFVILSPSAVAHSISFGLGTGDEDILATRISSVWDWEKQWPLRNQWFFTGYWEASLSHWNGEPGESSNDEITLVAATPVFVWQYQSSHCIPYLQLAVGASWLSDTKLGDKELSTHFQFEDRLGLGIRFKQWDINLTAFHYSNAGIEHPNNGINLLLLNTIYRF